MVDHQIDGDQRIDLLRIAAELPDGVAHRRQVDDRRYAGKVLHQDAGRPVGDLAGRFALLEPGAEGPDIVGGHGAAVFVAQHILQQHLQREGQPADIAADIVQAVFGRPGQAVVGVGLAAGLKGLAGIEAVLRSGQGHGSGSGCRGARAETGTLGQTAARRFRFSGFRNGEPVTP